MNGYVFWTAARLAEARAEVAAQRERSRWGFLEAAAAALEARWGVPVSMHGMRAALKRNPAATTPPPPPPEDDVEVLEELPPEGGERWPRRCEKISQPETYSPATPVWTEAWIPPAPAVHTSRTRGEAYLIIPDTQDPYSAPGWLHFADAVAKEHNVDRRERGRVFHSGDETDQYWASFFDKDPDFPHTGRQELQASRERMREFAALFPLVRFARSNHGTRWEKRAAKAQIPSEMLRAYREVIDAPPGWEWADEWIVRASKHPWRLEHGHTGAKGQNGTRQKVIDSGLSTAHGHEHTTANIVWVYCRGRREQQWGMNVAALIDEQQKCFDYGKESRFRATMGIGVVLDGGRMPLWVPYGG